MTQSDSKPSLRDRAEKLTVEVFGEDPDTILAAIIAFAQAVAAESAPRWIPVGERLPELNDKQYDDFLVWGWFNLEKFSGVARFSEGTWWSIESWEDAEPYEYPGDLIRGWQPLPTAPTTPEAS